MYGEQAYAVDVVAVDGFAAQILVPGLEEVVDASDMPFEIVGKLVEEGADVGVLLLEPVEAEKRVEALGQVDERLGEQARALTDIVRGKQRL